mgnify:CR=1 FL=1
MLKLIDAEKAKLFGLPPNDIADESKYPRADIENAIAAGAFKLEPNKTSGTTSRATTQASRINLGDKEN